jgi:pimeloyl-ACP methyl ester carboxylesterase
MASDVRRAAFQVLTLVVFVALVGATYQGVTTALERREFGRPGRMVDIGDYQLHIVCSGAGSPVVVLEAPAAGVSAAWGWVQPALAARTRVCSYDRAGLGWSEAQEGDFDPGRSADDLRRLLDGAGEAGPYVLVGQGLGSSLAQVFAGRFPQAVRGLVLVDSPSAGGRGPSALLVEYPALTPWLARVGILRAMGVAPQLTDGLPPSERGALASFLNRPDHLTRSARELRKWDEAMASAITAPLPAGLVVERLTTARPARVGFLVREDDATRVVLAVLRVLAPGPAAAAE